MKRRPAELFHRSHNNLEDFRVVGAVLAILGFGACVVALGFATWAVWDPGPHGMASMEIILLPMVAFLGTILCGAGMGMTNGHGKLVRLTADGVQYGAMVRGWRAVEAVSFRPVQTTDPGPHFYCVVTMHEALEGASREWATGPPLPHDQADTLKRKLTSFFQGHKIHTICR